ncbi:hypothetical protein E2C01_097328 [Portunus trituberculatus]|uniref:Uncharacterized protein n=1 Tax=Portunus trituberculatus TaxID=210409 RepID=A0A5B7K051_PORTR|nr:hypothetical protein [Portunus trituberculatus]
MPVNSFCNLLTKIKPFISKADTRLHTSISAAARLEATLRFLAAEEPTQAFSNPQESPSTACDTSFPRPATPSTMS